MEEAVKNFECLAMLEDLKTMSFSAVWDYCSLLENVSVGAGYITEIQKNEAEVFSKDKKVS